MTRPASPDLHQQANYIRTWGAVVVIGAGVSRSLGFPLARELHELVWHGLDCDVQARDALATRLGVADAPTKYLVGDNDVLVEMALRSIAVSPRARRAYQHGFANLNNERSKQPSPAHDGLAQLLHRGTVEFVISLNWDTLLEAAYLRQYGVQLRRDSRLLYKPHGDASFPDEDWVLPHEDGRVSTAIEDHIKALKAGRPRVLLVLGYSERDEEVVKKLIRPLSAEWRVIRISPGAHGELDIPLVAERAIPKLVAAIHPNQEMPGWEYIRFDHQHDLTNALLGRRLGPTDVEACPPLAEVDEADKLLRVSNSVEIVAEPGHGKSITAYQVAHRLWQEGREALQPIDPQSLSTEMIDSIEHLRNPAVVVLDDAQLVDERVVKKLVAASSRKLAVITAATEPTAANRGEIRISGRRAVEVLARSLRQQRHKTLQIVRQLDTRIGEGSFDQPIERRIDEAAKSETPWQFMFVLTSGWQRAQSSLAALRGMGRSDLLLGIVATGQFLSRDGGVPRSWLDRVAKLYERDSSWVERSLQALNAQHVVVGSDYLRCLHINFAEVVLKILVEDRDDPSWSVTLGMLRTCVLKPDVPLGGVQWLLFRVWYMDLFRWDQTAVKTIIDDQALHYLAERCWAAISPEEIRDAAYLLMTLLRWRPDTTELLMDHVQLLRTWLESADQHSATGISWLLNDISNERRDIAKAVCNAADPEVIAASLTKIDCSSMEAWGSLLSRLKVAAHPDWCQRLVQGLDRSALLELPRHITMRDLYGFDELWESLLSLDAELGLEFVSEGIPAISGLINTRPIDAISRLDSLFFLFPIFSRVLSRKRELPPRLRHMYRTLARAIDPYVITTALQTGAPRDWHYVSNLLQAHNYADPYSAKQITQRLDFDLLDDATEGYWREMHHDLHELIDVLDITAAHEPARSWLLRHRGELERPTITLARIIPEVCVDLIREGETFDLATATGTRWEWAASALKRLGSIDNSAAQDVLTANYSEIAKGLTNPHGSYDETLDQLLDVMSEVSPDAIDCVLMEADPAVLEERLVVVLRGGRRERQVAAKLIEIAVSMPNPYAEMAVRLRQQFPVSSRRHNC